MKSISGKGKVWVPKRRIHSKTSCAPTAASRAASSRASYWNTVLGPSIARSSSSEGVHRKDCGQDLEASSEFSVEQAVKERSSDRPFRCDEGCKREFSQRSHLNQHVRTVHRQQRPFRCQKCDWAFGKHFDLTSHDMAVHKHKRPHVCAICSRAFAKRSNLYRHQEKLHADKLLI